MAARRLILVMLVLLVLSSAVAALIPIQRDTAGDTTSTTTTVPEEPPASGDLVRRRVAADASKVQTIRIDRGDQLELTVSSSRPGQVEIPVLGELEDVDRFTPARFDLLPFDRGNYDVRLHPPDQGPAAGRVIARIVVEPGAGPPT